MLLLTFHWVVNLINDEKKKKYDTVGTVPKTNWKIVERLKINTPDHSHSIKSVQDNVVFYNLNKMMPSRWGFSHAIEMPTLTYNWTNSVMIKNDIILNIMNNIYNGVQWLYICIWSSPPINNTPVQTDCINEVSEFDLPNSCNHSTYNTDRLNGNPVPKPFERKAAIRTNHFRSNFNLVSDFSAVWCKLSIWSHSKVLLTRSCFMVVVVSVVLLKSFCL